MTARALLLLVLLTGACNKDTPEIAPVPTESTRKTTTSFPGSLTPVSTPPTEYRYLSAVRAGAHDGFDRVVFEFESGVPGYSVNYVDRPITEDGSGNRMDIDGDAVLSVRMEAASGADTTGTALRQTYAGPRQIDGPEGGVVDEVVRTGDFEAVLSWVIGVKTKGAFHVYTSEGRKLVIDIDHAG